MTMIRFSSEAAAGSGDAAGPVGQKRVPSGTPVSQVPVNVRVLVEHDLRHRP